MKIWPFGKNSKYDQLKEAIRKLCREWIDVQTRDLDADDIPPEAEIESDTLRMTDEVFTRITPLIETTNAISKGSPADDANTDALETIINRLNEHEALVPSFTKLALGKIEQAEYATGWGLCAVRLIVESALNQIIAEQTNNEVVTGSNGEEESIQKLVSLLTDDAPANWHQIQSIFIFEDQAMLLKNYSRESADGEWKALNLERTGFEVMDWWEAYQQHNQSTSSNELTAARAILNKENKLRLDDFHEALILPGDNNIFTEDILQLANKLWGSK